MDQKTDSYESDPVQMTGIKKRIPVDNAVILPDTLWSVCSETGVSSLWSPFDILHWYGDGGCISEI